METEWNGTEQRPVTIQLIPVQQQQKPKRVFVLPRERRLAHLVSINVMGGMGVQTKREAFIKR